LALLGFELRALCLLGMSEKGSTNWYSIVWPYYNVLNQSPNFFFFLQHWGLNSRSQADTLPFEPLCQSFIILGIFKVGSLKLFAPGWLQTLTLLISAVAWATGAWLSPNFKYLDLFLFVL
jgi:hypothetical protein